MDTSEHTLYQFHDFQLLDVNNRPVGTVDWIWADDERGSAAFLGVHLQWLRGRARAVPAQGAGLDVRSRTIRVPYPQAQIRSAPRFAIDRALRPTDQQTIVSHYVCSTVRETSSHASLRDLQRQS